MNESSKAVFLSYARDDAAAARRIAEALRSAGLEVWFDENELRGGDTWDAKIRQQIDACSLFIPVISGHTQERSKGYFRLEWKLAVDQTHLLAAGVPFIAPVVVDDTKESAAVVPPEFMKVQWSRLPGALPTPQFVEQVKRLLSGEKGSSFAKASVDRAGSKEQGAESRAEEDGGRRTEDSKASRKSFPPVALWISLAAVFVSVGVVFFVTRKKDGSPPVAAASAESPSLSPSLPPPPRRNAVADKSIAVLPFTNMSEEKDSAFFTDGIHEDILTNLALVRQLRVVSRTSVMSYRKPEKSMRQIAQELGVTYILEGSVRRSGNKVRVTGQLIHAATDEHVWAATYDRDLTDIFALQTELSQQIAGALKAALSPEEKAFIARKPTDNPEAYDAYLRGRDIRNRAPTASPDALAESEKLFQRGVDLDPNFAAAWGELAVVHALRVFWEQDASAGRKAKGDAAIARARQLAPESPEVIRLVGTHAYYAYRDYATATANYQRIISLQPNDASGYASLGLILRRQGRWAESLVLMRRALELDPGNISYVRAQISSLAYGRRWAELLPLRDRVIALLPGKLVEELMAGNDEWRGTGSTARLEAVLARLTAEERESPPVRLVRKNIAINRDDYAEFKRLHQLQPTYAEIEIPAFSLISAAGMHRAHGDAAAARTEAERLRDGAKAVLTTQPENLRAQLFLATAEAFLGDKSAALEGARRVLAIVPESRDALDGPACRYAYAVICALVGEKDEAIAQLTLFLSRPGSVTVREIRTDPTLYDLRGDPRFEALLNDPKNSAPLF